jgi:hypothetical protein
MRAITTGCAMCAQRITGEGFPSYCADFSTGATDPGRRIPDDKIATSPAWCPKKGSAA